MKPLQTLGEYEINIKHKPSSGSIEEHWRESAIVNSLKAIVN